MGKTLWIGDVLEGWRESRESNDDLFYFGARMTATSPAALVPCAVGGKEPEGATGVLPMYIISEVMEALEERIKLPSREDRVKAVQYYLERDAFIDAESLKGWTPSS